MHQAIMPTLTVVHVSACSRSDCLNTGCWLHSSKAQRPLRSHALQVRLAGLVQRQERRHIRVVVGDARQGGLPALPLSAHQQLIKGWVEHLQQRMQMFRLQDQAL